MEVSVDHEEQPPGGLVVLAWRNLHLPGHTWSVRRRGGTRVEWRTGLLVLGDVELVVRPAGRDRARREGVRNVHAYVRGTVVVDGGPAGAGRQATYTPFGDHPSFTLTDGSPVGTASWARLDGGGLWLWGASA